MGNRGVPEGDLLCLPRKERRLDDWELMISKLAKRDNLITDQMNGMAVHHLDNVNGGTRRPGIGLDDFELLTVIGRGSYAKVVQAEHK